VHDLLALDLVYALRSFCRQDPVGGPGDDIDKDRCRTFLRHYRCQSPLADADLAALPEVFQAQRLIVVAKKCNNLLIKQAMSPRLPKDALGFALLLRRECARVRRLTDNPITVTEDT
jgi:Ser/Thr protein kinase RdoA (MazF antagonist)